MLENISNGLKSGLRLGQTARAISVTGIRWLGGHRPPTPVMMREAFERLGATYIKLGQFIASAPSLFPREYVEAFQGCLDSVPTLPWSQIEAVLKQEFDQPLDEIFASIDHQALASASIAQVHAARLINGEDVVIKIRKPGVRNVLLTDFNFLRASAKVLQLVAPGLARTSISEILADIQATMLEECDFLAEANNIETFDQYLRDTGNDRAVVPKVYRQASTSGVLTMERFYGVGLTDLEAIRSCAPDPEFTLITALNTWVGSLIHNQFFHADVHAGNLMVLRDGRIGFIDFGIVGRIKEGTWQGLVEFMQGRALEDFDVMAKAMVAIGATNVDVDTAKLSRDLAQLVDRVERIDPMNLAMSDPRDAVDDPQVNELMLSIVELGKQHGLKFPREFALLLKQLLYFDRYMQALAPDLEFFGDPRINVQTEFTLH